MMKQSNFREQILENKISVEKCDAMGNCRNVSLTKCARKHTNGMRYSMVGILSENAALAAITNIRRATACQPIEILAKLREQ